MTNEDDRARNTRYTGKEIVVLDVLCSLAMFSVEKNKDRKLAANEMVRTLIQGRQDMDSLNAHTLVFREHKNGELVRAASRLVPTKKMDELAEQGYTAGPTLYQIVSYAMERAEAAGIDLSD